MFLHQHAQQNMRAWYTLILSVNVLIKAPEEGSSHMEQTTPKQCKGNKLSHAENKQHFYQHSNKLT